jgi:hypothetical protein
MAGKTMGSTATVVSVWAVQIEDEVVTFASYAEAKDWRRTQRNPRAVIRRVDVDKSPS